MRWFFLAGLVFVAMLAAGAWHWWPRPIDIHEDEPDTGPAWFADITDAAGIDFVHATTPLGKHFMPETFGSGAAVFDCDGDGKLDILLLSNGGPASKATNKLYRNLGGGKFADVSQGSGLDFAGHCMGVAVGDVNNDGRPDVLITLYAGARLFLNEGSGRFKDVTESAGLRNPAWGTSTAFLDFDRDGRLDLVIVNYIDYDPSWNCTFLSDKPDYCSPNVFPGTVTRLFRNLGPGKKGEPVTFDDVTLPSGLGLLPGPGLGVGCADFNGDGWPDIFVANDGKPNRLWINQKDGTFKDEAATRGVAFDVMGKAQAGMGVALGDVNGDGLLDLFVTHLTTESHTLWQQGPAGLFTDRTADARLVGGRRHGTGFGTLFADFDHDGAPDLAIANGRVARNKAMVNADLGPHWGWYAEPNQLYANDGNGRFTDISGRNAALCGTPNVARGLACGDFDGDGAPDLLLTTAGGRARLFRNVAPGRGHWLMLRCLLPTEKRHATGALVQVEAGTRRWVRGCNPAESYLCSSAPEAHVGVGAATQIDRIIVTWPDGVREEYAGGGVDRLIELRRGEGKRADQP